MSEYAGTHLGDIWDHIAYAVFGSDVPAPHVLNPGVLRSAFDVAPLLAASQAATAAALSRLCARPTTCVSVDMRLAALWARAGFASVGWDSGAAWDPLSRDMEASDTFIRLHTNATHHRAALLRVLGVDGHPQTVARAVGTWRAAELEAAINEAGGAAAMYRSAEDWRSHPQSKAVSDLPLVSWSMRSHVGTCRTLDLPLTSSRPLTGLRVLDLTRVLAGPVATRFLAGCGATVLRIDPGTWEEPGLLPDTALGKRCASLDLKSAKGQATLAQLIADADLLVHGYRPGALAGLGFDPDRLSALNPAMPVVSLSAYGGVGPWGDRRGFDSLVQCATGIAHREAAKNGSDRPGKLPVQAIDHATGNIMAAACLEAIARARRGEICGAALCLARTGLLLQSFPAEDRLLAEIGETQEYDFMPDIEISAWGPVRRLKPAITMPGVMMGWSVQAGPLRSAPALWPLQTGEAQL
jgi:crotonobetainyl-CoA:carnitine CoA-transferase CaiB-like acyl-CoA transferase